MAINIQLKNDYSYLFSGLGSGSSGANLNFLSDYASIKNGSYAKLLKAYYSKDGSEQVSKLAEKYNTTAATKEQKSLAKVQSTTDALKESADKLLESKGEDTVWNHDAETIYKAVSSFISDYNSVISAADDSGNDRVTNRAAAMANTTLSNIKTLNKLGITMNQDATLSIDKESFLKADMNTAKTMFQDTGSYGYRISAQASMINFAADNEASKSSIYTAGGTASKIYSSGNLFSTWF